MKKISVIKSYKPLFKIEKGLVLSKNEKVYIENGNKIDYLFSFPTSLLTKILNKSKLFYRMNRSGVGASIYFNSLSFFSFNRVLYCYDFSLEKLTVELDFIKGRGPLQFTEIKDMKDFDTGIYYGEYFGNSSRASISIFKRTENSTWESVYTFKCGEINHIHALIPDPFRGCVWILAGDFEHSAAIYMANNNFETVKLVLGGKQSYRACIAYPVQDGLLYATDTQIEKNSIRFLRKIKDEWISEKLFNINGPCIYSCELKDYYIFSTSTEPSEKKTGLIKRIMDNEPAEGIIENKSDIVQVTKSNLSYKIIASKKKDIWPYRLFQFGSIMFASNSADSNELYTYNVGSKELDLSTEYYSLNKD
jgi:hypothetical protein